MDLTSSLTDSTTVALRRDRRAEYTGSHIDRFQKEVSLGTFIMQPHDVVVGKLELLEAVEVGRNRPDKVVRH